MSLTTIIFDNGGHNMKIGTIDSESPRLVPNSIVKAKHEKKRVFVAHEQEECSDKFSLFYVRPIERGYVVNWDTQQQIWEKTFGSMDVEASTSRIALTDNNYLIPALPDVSSEILFDYFGFTEVHKTSASTLVAKHSNKINNEKCAVVVDSGFSWTTVASFVNGMLIQDSVIRIDVGGKALTNKLKDWVSYRQLNVSEETYVINECKEDLCFVSQNFDESMKEARNRFQGNTTMKRYIMPDFHSTFRGVVKDVKEPHDPQIPSIHLGVERFAIPEILFNPSDIDIDQCGVAEAVIESICQCPEALRPALAENIIVIGGSSCFPGFRERLEREVRSMLPAEYGLNVSNDVINPQTHSWHCGQELLTASKVPWINRKDWDERGDSLEFSNFFQTLVQSDELKGTRNFDDQREKSPKEDEDF
nr:actin-related protein-like [Caenorhabditis elegans]